MKGSQIVLDHIDMDGETVEAAALIAEGRLQDLIVDHPDQPAPGAIYRAICDRPVKGQGGMFVKTPEGMGFLRQLRGYAPGQTVMVQVTGYAEPGKALPLTTKVLFKSRYAIVTPGAPGMNISRALKDDDLRDELTVIAHEVFGSHPVAELGAGLILRSACEGADMEDVAEDIAAMADLAAQVLADEGSEAELLVDGPTAHELALRDWPQSQVSDPGAKPLAAFEAEGVLDLLGPFGTEAPLSGSGSLFIEATRACVSIDVNTGGDNSPAAGLKANLNAARELPRQLRVRGLGGIIYLDLAPMGKKDRRQFEGAIKAAFRADQIETVLAGWTPLGNFELQRKRDRLPQAGILAKLMA
ncbi:ribonuclease E/G [Pseudooceanicola sp. CBS1P-1]|uniref:Ribonuclease G n=1 Tax=Pseudooceanicola albus TaxID=2692189 RepID=A0A6L7G962_9RHOB|nr:MULTISPECIES: ribonuclease E/G [Pseudooceanicola]MBT9386475.1 ribonuclease E/G [Pseudooceanicola endophyticus]MXN20509.1 ribonuclease G [Pseudooceanicola albus]